MRIISEHQLHVAQTSELSARDRIDVAPAQLVQRCLGKLRRKYIPQEIHTTIQYSTTKQAKKKAHEILSAEYYSLCGDADPESGGQIERIESTVKFAGEVPRAEVRKLTGLLEEVAAIMG